MKLTRTIAIDGNNKDEYQKIVAHLESLQANFPEWTLHKEPLVNRVTAIKTEEVDSL